METKSNHPLVSILGGAVSGMVIAFLTSRRDIHAGEPSVIDKAKMFEKELYLAGQTRAETLKQIKLEAKIEATK
ncbi:hypothetical protein [Oceanobacillus sp. CAU 1775]